MEYFWTSQVNGWTELAEYLHASTFKDTVARGFLASIFFSRVYSNWDPKTLLPVPNLKSSIKSFRKNKNTQDLNLPIGHPTNPGMAVLVLAVYSLFFTKFHTCIPRLVEGGFWPGGYTMGITLAQCILVCCIFLVVFYPRSRCFFLPFKLIYCFEADFEAKTIAIFFRIGILRA